MREYTPEFLSLLNDAEEVASSAFRSHEIYPKRWLWRFRTVPRLAVVGSYDMTIKGLALLIVEQFEIELMRKVAAEIDYKIIRLQDLEPPTQVRQ